jgi:O-antigen ligase
MRFFSGNLRRSMAPIGLDLRRTPGGLGFLLAWNGPLVTFLALALALAAGLFLVRLPLLDGVLLVGLAVVGVATVIEPTVGLAAALFLGPLRAYLRTEVPQVPAQIGQFFVALALAAWLARGLARRSVRIPHPPLLLPLLAFLGAALVSLWDAVDLPAYGVPELIKWAQIVLVVLFVSDRLAVGMEDPVRKRSCAGAPSHLRALDARTCSGLSPRAPADHPNEVVETLPSSQAAIENRAQSRRLRWLLGALLVTGLFQAVVGVWQFGLRGEGPDHFAIASLGDHFYRAYGTFEQPNPYAGYVGVTLSLAIGVLIGTVGDRETRRQGDKETRRPGDTETRRHGDTETRRHIPSPCHLVTLSPCLLVLLLVTIALGAALAMSWSRGAWLGFGAAIVAMAVALPRRARWGLLLVAILAVGGLGLYATGRVPPSVVVRLTGFGQYVQFEDVRGVGINDANYAVIERLAHWQAALEMFRHDLWTGVGLGCYEPAYADFALINWPIALGHAHNYYLTVAAETGLVGLAAYLLLWGAVFWQTWQATRRTRGFLRGIAIGLLGAWTHLSVHHFLDNLYVNNVHLHVGVLLGLLAFVIQQAGKSANRQISESATQRIGKPANRLTDQSTN